jgi:hypothetical protein
MLTITDTVFTGNAAAKGGAVFYEKLVPVVSRAGRRPSLTLLERAHDLGPARPPGSRCCCRKGGGSTRRGGGGGGGSQPPPSLRRFQTPTPPQAQTFLMDGITVANNTAQEAGPAIFTNRADQTQAGARGAALTLRFAATCRFSGGLGVTGGRLGLGCVHSARQSATQQACSEPYLRQHTPCKPGHARRAAPRMPVAAPRRRQQARRRLEQRRGRVRRRDVALPQGRHHRQRAHAGDARRLGHAAGGLHRLCNGPGVARFAGLFRHTPGRRQISRRPSRHLEPAPEPTNARRGGDARFWADFRPPPPLPQLPCAIPRARLRPACPTALGPNPFSSRLTRTTLCKPSWPPARALPTHHALLPAPRAPASRARGGRREHRLRRAAGRGGPRPLPAAC